MTKMIITIVIKINSSSLCSIAKIDATSNADVFKMFKIRGLTTSQPA